VSDYTRDTFAAEYPDDAACLAAILRIQHGGRDLYCPACMVKARFHPMHGRRGFACQDCGYHFFPCAGTVFARSSTPLTKWFLAMYLMTGTRGGISAKTLQRELGVTYKTAWRMRAELRKLMVSAAYRGALAGALADEAG
jgi:transposase-like protein